MASFSIRRAVAGDAEGILECLRLAFTAYRESYTPQAFEDTVLTPGTIEQRLATMSVFVAVNPGGEVLGTIGYKIEHGREGHIRGMAVLPGQLGTGLAQRLLESVEVELRKRKCSRVTLDTTEPLKRAIRFYERNGFRPSGVVRDYFGMPLLEYVKNLD
jgi:ribosomal protein S18 acetylase RimI-like enzyme